MSYNPHELKASPAYSIASGLFPGPELPLSLEVITSEEPQSKDEKITRAVSNLIPSALERRQGILVIQRDYGKYTVRIDENVPCGTTLEFRE